MSGVLHLFCLCLVHVILLYLLMITHYLHGYILLNVKVMFSQFLNNLKPWWKNSLIHLLKHFILIGEVNIGPYTIFLKTMVSFIDSRVLIHMNKIAHLNEKLGKLLISALLS